jgi:AcrR family transcriptional regulator
MNHESKFISLTANLHLASVADIMPIPVAVYDHAAETDAEPAIRRKPNRAEKAEATRARLFDAAINIVGEYGYAGTSVARITERAKVAQGTFYNYFESRQDLLDQLLPAISNQLHAHIKKRVLEATTPLGRERARIVAFFEFLEESPHLFKILSEGPVQAPEGFKRHLEQQTESYKRAMRYELRQGNLRITDLDELDVVTEILISSREYLGARFGFVDGHFTRAPDYVIEAYMKVAERVLFKAADE